MRSNPTVPARVCRFCIVCSPKSAHACRAGVDMDTKRVAQRRALSPVLQVEEFRPLSSTVRVEFGACSDGKPRNAPIDDHYLVVRLGRTQETVLTSLMEGDVPGRFLEYGYAMLLADGIGG